MTRRVRLEDAVPSGVIAMPTAVASQFSRRTPHFEFDSHAHASPAESLSRWRDNLARSWDMGLPDKADEDRFTARVKMWKLEQTLLGSGEFGPVQTRARRDRNIRADQLDHYRVMLIRSGQFNCDAGGQQLRLTSGQLVITDMARAESSESACATALLYIPREPLERALPRALDLHGVSPRNACASLLAEHLNALSESMPGTRDEELPGLEMATINLVAASVAQTAANEEGARAAVECVLLRRARRHIDGNLADEELGATQLCSHLRVSRSTLYRVFEPVGGVSQFIRERRLSKVHEILSRGGERTQISRLAEAHGFKSAAHFSKAFREQYGYCARETPRYQPLNQVSTSERRFEDWLGALMH